MNDAVVERLFDEAKTMLVANPKLRFANLDAAARYRSREDVVEVDLQKMANLPEQFVRYLIFEEVAHSLCTKSLLH
jgi:hypothetical protein